MCAPLKTVPMSNKRLSFHKERFDTLTSLNKVHSFISKILANQSIFFRHTAVIQFLTQTILNHGQKMHHLPFQISLPIQIIASPVAQRIDCVTIFQNCWIERVCIEFASPIPHFQHINVNLQYSIGRPILSSNHESLQGVWESERGRWQPSYKRPVIDRNAAKWCRLVIRKGVNVGLHQQGWCSYLIPWLQACWLLSPTFTRPLLFSFPVFLFSASVTMAAVLSLTLDKRLCWIRPKIYVVYLVNILFPRVATQMSPAPTNRTCSPAPDIPARTVPEFGDSLQPPSSLLRELLILLLQTR